MLLLPIRLYRVRLTQCSCVDALSLALVIHGCTLYGSSSCRMSTRRLPVIIFVSCFECTLFPVGYCLVGLWWQRGLLLICALRRVNILRLSKVFYLLSSSRRLHRLSNNLTARDFVRVVMLTDSFITLAICIICQFCCPFSADYQSDR